MSMAFYKQNINYQSSVFDCPNNRILAVFDFNGLKLTNEHGGYFRDHDHRHHITFPAVLETPPNSNAYATLKVYKDHVSVVGVGVIDQYEIYY